MHSASRLQEMLLCHCGRLNFNPTDVFQNVLVVLTQWYICGVLMQPCISIAKLKRAVIALLSLVCG